MAINIKITETAKESLDWLKSNYQFNNFSDCINTVGTFFKSNYVSPRDNVSTSFSENLSGVKNEIVKLKKFIDKDSQSLRKRHGAIERDYFIGMNRKLDAVFKILVKDSVEKNNTILEKEVVSFETSGNENNNDNLIIKLKKEITEYSDQLQNFSTIVNTQENVFKEYKNQFNVIKKNIIYEKNTFGKTKVVIELTQEEVENIFNKINSL